MQVDHITVEIIKGALKAAGREMGLLIERTAMSAFIREKKDFFAGMYDAQGHLVFTDHDKFGPGMVDCVLEVYPAATLVRLGIAGTPSEDSSVKLGRVLDFFVGEIDGLSSSRDELSDPHALDAVVAAYTGALEVSRLDAPPADFNVAAGWIWLPRGSLPRLGN